MSPRHVRPFWIDVQIDGREKNVAGGPKSLAGGLVARLSVRSKEGRVITPIIVVGSNDPDTKERTVIVGIKGKMFSWTEAQEHWPAMLHALGISDAERTEALRRAVKEIAEYANETGLNAVEILEEALAEHMEGNDG